MTQSKSTSIIDTLQSLLVAFTLAMVFRGFIIEGFVIPTGSMAPTLLGQHLVLTSSQTGVATPVGLDARGRPDLGRLRDHTVGRSELLRPDKAELRPRAGDRVLVLKTLFPFWSPDRWDVTVFRNPTQPEGAAANYIKRMVGLPGESVWIIDGDLFIKGANDSAFAIARKPDHVQSGVWQRLHDGGRPPASPETLTRDTSSPWTPVPTNAWEHNGTTWQHSGTSTASLTWNDHRIPLDDWVAYNMFSPVPTYPASDLRIGAAVTVAEGGQAEFELAARSHLFRFIMSTNGVGIEMSRADNPNVLVESIFDKGHSIIGGVAASVEVEHRDQTAIIRIHGNEVARIQYDWTPRERLEYSTGLIGSTMSDMELTSHLPQAPQMQWTVSGGPASIASISVDRDLFYRRDLLRQNAITHAPDSDAAGTVRPGRPGAATSPDSIITLKDDQYFMLGDNSGRSNDGRLWGWPHPMVAELVDPDPFVVNEDLLVGKAFVVYYPAAHPIVDGGMSLVPDFGRLRFIR